MNRNGEALIKVIIVIVFIALVFGYVRSEVIKAKVEGRNQHLLEQLDSILKAHDIFESDKLVRDSIQKAEIAALKIKSDSLEQSWRRASNRATSLRTELNDILAELDDEGEDADRLRDMFDAIDDELDACSLAYENCTVITAQLEERNNTLETDYAHAAEIITTLQGANESLLIELEKANSTDWLPWGIAAGEFLLLLALLMFK